jgi:hypothetical protein
VGLAILLSVFLTALYLTFRDNGKKVSKKDRFEESISAFSSKERLREAFEGMKDEKRVSELKA